MYLPPLDAATQHIASWDYRRDLLRQRIASVDADIVCLQEVSPLSFDDDFAFMNDLGYDGKEMFKKGRFRPATFYKSSRVKLITPAVHKDRTLLTIFQPVDDEMKGGGINWYILNCHLQAGKQASRRLRQMNEGIKAVFTAARKLKGTPIMHYFTSITNIFDASLAQSCILLPIYPRRKESGKRFEFDCMWRF